LREPKRPNIIFFLLDTVRASDAYNDSSLTFINSLARGGTKYERAIAPGTWTAPSHAAMFMDAKVSSIKNISKDFFNGGGERIDPWMVKNKFLDKDSATIARKMSGFGYQSVLFSTNPFLTSQTNLATGFDKIFDVWLQSNIKYNKKLVDRFSFVIKGGESTREKMYLLSDLLTRALPKPVFDMLYLYLRRRMAENVSSVEGATKLDKGAKEVNSALSRYLERDYRIAPHFLFMNYMEAHENYPVGRSRIMQDKWLYLSGIEELDYDIANRLHRGYVKRIRYMDGKVGEAMALLKRNGMLDDAVVVLASDHGQLFGEHGGLYHSIFPYEGIAHVPLIIARYNNGKIVKTGKRIEDTVSLRTVHAEIIKAAGGRTGIADRNGHSKGYVLNEHTGIIEGWDEPLLRRLKGRSDYAKRIYEAKSNYNRKVTAVYEGTLKLIHYFGKKQDELYNIESDPKETNNLIGSMRSDALRLAQRGLRLSV
jgi:arylsulfatase A-like enzyme